MASDPGVEKCDVDVALKALTPRMTRPPPADSGGAAGALAGDLVPLL